MADATGPAVSPLDAWAMRQALDQAHNAWLIGEVPVGAVILREGQVIATGYNRPITTHDPTAHAELVALRHAAHLLENYRLPGCEIFITLEPCAMCAMALMHARFKRVVFGAWDPKTGVAGSVLNLFAQPQLNHHTVVTGGVMEAECGDLLRRFFAERREQKRQERLARQTIQARAAALVKALQPVLDRESIEANSGAEAPGSPSILLEDQAEAQLPEPEVLEWSAQDALDTHLFEAFGETTAHGTAVPASGDGGSMSVSPDSPPT